MSTVQQAIEVSAPVHAVYERFATFESYPQFMTGVEQVIQTSSNETHWIMDLDGQRREFDAEIIECSLDQRVSWAAVGGPLLAETITLRPLGETRTQIVAQLEADVAGLMPSDRHGQESLNRRLKADLASFKLLIESDSLAGSHDLRSAPTGTMPGSGFPSTRSGNTGSADTGASTKSLNPSAGTRGAPGTTGPASPAEVAARANRNQVTGGPVGRHGAAADGNAARLDDDADLRAMLAPGTHIGDAEMGGQAMSTDDIWGDGMINEEERGGTHER